MEITAEGIRRIVFTFYEVGLLRTTRRAHSRRIFEHDDSDSIAAHSFRAAIIAWLLAGIEGADPYRATMMALLHDFPEARTSDLDWVARRYVIEEEERAARDQLIGVPGGEELLEIQLEFLRGESPEAKVAKDADRLDQLLLLKEYAHQGNHEAEDWLHLDDFERRSQSYIRLSTESARRLAQEIVRQRPSEWWDNLWSAEKRGNQETGT